MPTTTLDCRGLPCPQPVLQCKHSLDAEQPATLSVLVDNEAALENVSRFLRSQGMNTQGESQGHDLWRITAWRTLPATDVQTEQPRDRSTAQPPDEGKALVFLTTQGIGQGDDELGDKLMASFLATLPEMGAQLWRVILLNGAVRLAVQGSPVLDSLKKLEIEGVSILVCGTCLTHLNLLQEKAVGQTTNMLDVVTSLQLASKIIRP
jgi:selenium metabolism protein YedF